MLLCQHIGWKITFLYYFMPFSNVPWLSYINTRLSSSVSATPPKSFPLPVHVIFLPQYRWSSSAAGTYTIFQAQKQSSNRISSTEAIPLAVIITLLLFFTPKGGEMKLVSVGNMLFGISPTEIQAYVGETCCSQRFGKETLSLGRNTCSNLNYFPL